MKLILSFTLFLVVALCCAQSAEAEEPFSCISEENFDKDCHTCKCGATGTYAVCSGFTCDPVNKSIRMKAPENCKDGDKWSDGCNDCVCSNGYFACTRAACVIVLGEKPVEPQEPIV